MPIIKMKIFVGIFLIILFGSLETSGFRCRVCDNAKNFEDCAQNDEEETCNDGGGAQSCQTTVRIRNETQVELFFFERVCKQRTACRNNEDNNPVDCRRDNDHYVCRCCCDTDLCIQTQCGGVIFGPMTTTDATRSDPLTPPPPPPICEKPDAPVNGAVNCSLVSNTFELGHTCQYKCDKGYTLVGIEETTCVRNGSEAMFTKPTPTCNVTNCDKPLDLIIVLDSSSSIGGQNWYNMITYVREFLTGLVINRRNVNVAAFRYNRAIDDDNAIFFNMFASLNRKLLTQRLRRFQYFGGGTLTGNALKYAREHVINSSKREDVDDALVVLTDGNSQDFSTVEEEADSLKTAGVTTYAIGVNGNEGLNKAELSVIAGDDNNRVFELNDGVGNFSVYFDKIFENINCIYGI